MMFVRNENAEQILHGQMPNPKLPEITQADYLGPCAIIEGDHKLVIHEQKNAPAKIALFALKTDPAEKTNLADEKPQLARKLQADLRLWQDSALKSLTGADYRE